MDMEEKQKQEKEKRMPPALSMMNAYKDAEISTLSQKDLLIKLYEGTERFLIRGQAGIRNENFELAHEGCTKAKRILTELLSTLNFEVGGDIANDLKALYIFMISEITRANLEKSADRIDAVLPIIRTLLEGWKAVPDNESNTSSLTAGCNNNFTVLK